MTRIIFIHADGTSRTEAVGATDLSLLDVAQAAGMPLEGTCEGQMACSTCHVIIADPTVFATLPRASEAEEDMLDLATGAVRTSRLACQLSIAALPDGIEVRIPDESRDMQGL
jgi:ferredoxin-2, mitochondrial